MSTEIWKDIIGYEGQYQISSYGKIKSMERILPPNSFHSKRHKKEKILNGSKDCAGYLRIRFSNNGVKSKYLSIHRLVAIYFIPNPFNLPEVNHLKGIKSDNRASELEWCTRSENQYHAYATGLKKPAKSTMGGKWNKRSKPIIQIFEDGTTKVWEGIRMAGRELNLNPSNLWSVIHGRAKTCGGFKWESHNP